MLVLISITVLALDTANLGPVNSVKSGLGAVLSPVVVQLTVQPRSLFVVLVCVGTRWRSC